jgi:hypothetical protein
LTKKGADCALVSPACLQDYFGCAGRPFEELQLLPEEQKKMDYFASLGTAIPDVILLTIKT